MLFLPLLLLLVPFALGKEYKKGDAVPFTITNLAPGGNPENGKHFLYPVDYFEDTINLCYGDKWVDANKEGQFDNSKYPRDQHVFQKDHLFLDLLNFGPRTLRFEFQEEVRCDQLCYRDYKPVNASRINDLVERDYRLHFLVDGMPVGKEHFDYVSNRFYMLNSVPLGYRDINHILHVYNHWQMVVYYVPTGIDLFQVVKAVMQQRSLKRVKDYDNQCQIFPPQVLRLKEDVDNRVIFTYDVVWKELGHDLANHHTWANRLDIYRHGLVPGRLESLQNVIFAVLVGAVFFFAKTRLETTRCARAGPEDSVGGWQDLGNDVYRKPAVLPLLAAVFGSGIQLLLVAGCVLLFLIFKIVSVVIPNQVKHTIFYLLLVTAPVQAYAGAKVYMAFHPQHATSQSPFSIKEHKKMALLSIFFTPACFAIANVGLNWAYGSVGSPKYLSLEVIINLAKRFVLFYAPASFMGTWVAFKQNSLPPVKVSMIEKAVPSSGPPILNASFFAALVGALFPFAVLANRLDSLWYLILFNNLYFGFWNYAICVFLSCAALALVATLEALNGLNLGNWRWQWSAIRSAFMAGFMCFVYGFKVVGWNKFGDHASLVIFVSENLMVSMMIALVLSAVNFVATWKVVRKLYGDGNAKSVSGVN